MYWIISGIGLPEMFIQAQSFDEALNTARKVNPNYSSGYVYEEQEVNHEAAR